jgi:hypothetical protein
MTSCYVMAGQLCYDVRGVKPRGVVVFKLYYVVLRASVSQSGHRVDVQWQSRNAGVEKFATLNFKVTAYNK